MPGNWMSASDGCRSYSIRLPYGASFPLSCLRIPVPAAACPYSFSSRRTVVHIAVVLRGLNTSGTSPCSQGCLTGCRRVRGLWSTPECLISHQTSAMVPRRVPRPANQSQRLPMSSVTKLKTEKKTFLSQARDFSRELLTLSFAYFHPFLQMRIPFLRQN